MAVLTRSLVQCQPALQLLFHSPGISFRAAARDLSPVPPLAVKELSRRVGSLERTVSTGEREQERRLQALEASKAWSSIRSAV